MNINLNDEQMRQVIGEAVIKTLSEDTRNTVIAAAIDHLLKPEKTYGGKSESPLQSAFNRAIANVAEQAAKEEIEKNEGVKEKLRGLLHEALDSLLANKDQSIKSVAKALSEAMTRRDEY